MWGNQFVFLFLPTKFPGQKPGEGTFNKIQITQVIQEKMSLSEILQEGIKKKRLENPSYTVLDFTNISTCL